MHDTMMGKPGKEMFAEAEARRVGSEDFEKVRERRCAEDDRVMFGPPPFSEFVRELNEKMHEQMRLEREEKMAAMAKIPTVEDVRAAAIAAGKKHDAGKLDLSLLDYELIRPLIEVLALGEARYGYQNWQKDFGPNWQRRFRAAMRRHDAASHGNPLARNSEDGNVYHLAQVAINALFELYHARKAAGDD